MKRPLLMGASLLVLVGILVAAVALASQPARHTIHPTPALTVTAWFEYRRTVGGEAAEYELRLANVGSASLTVSSGCYPLGAQLVDAGGRRFRATPHVDCGTGSKPVVLKPGETYSWSGPCFAAIGSQAHCQLMSPGTYVLLGGYSLTNSTSPITLPEAGFRLPGGPLAWLQERLLPPLPDPPDSARVDK